MFRAATIDSEKFFEVFRRLGELESSTRTVKFEVPIVVGVPLMVHPLLPLLSVNPAGSEPDVIEKV